MNKITDYDWTHLNQNRDKYVDSDTCEYSRYKGGTRKIAYAPPAPCRHPEHDSPGMCVFEPGVYEHTCPGCGRKQIFVVHGMYM